jgi:hypothetical protein
MRADLLRYPGLGGVVLDEALDRPRGEPQVTILSLGHRPAELDEQGFVEVCPLAEVAPNRLLRPIGEEDQTDFLPFPRTVNSSLERSRYRDSEQSSETRSAVEKNSSRIALSRRLLSSLPCGASRRRTSSSDETKSRLRSGTLASSIRSGGSVRMPRFTRYFRNERRAIR